MPEKGKGKEHAGHDGGVGGSSFGGDHLSHEPQAPKKTKSQMCAEQIFLKWMQADEFRKAVAFVEDKNKRWTTIFTHISGGDLLKDTTLRSLINQGFQPNVSTWEEDKHGRRMTLMRNSWNLPHVLCGRELNWRVTSVILLPHTMNCITWTRSQSHPI